MSLAKTIMIQGTASNVGKSVITAALCRIFYRRGYKVAPFKAQNMSNNSFVTLDGGEIGRAQAVQAQACGIQATAAMNPVLLKPDTDRQAQVISMGKPVTKIRSIGHRHYQRKFQPIVESALTSLRKQHDVVMIEGAGSPAEMNLKSRDIVNMSIAKSSKASVILVGDIDWGGIFAQLVGTYELFDSEEKKRVKAFLINKFRGDKKILDPGVDWIEKRTKKKVLGVIPYISDFELAEEDSISSNDSSSGLRNNVRLDRLSGKARDRRLKTSTHQNLLVDVIWLPRISNFTDFDLLKQQTDITFRYLHEPDRHTIPDLIILPGTKSTIADLAFLRKSGLADYVLRAAKAGVPILGICGGYQMLGKTIKDPESAESNQKQCQGLGLLPITTVYSKKKTTVQVTASHESTKEMFSAYEIHMGQTKVPAKLASLFKITQRKGKKCESTPEGVKMGRTIEGKKTWIWGTYLHGMLENPSMLQYFLNCARRRVGLKEKTTAVDELDHDRVLDQLADRVEKNMDTRFLDQILNGKK